MCGNYKPKNFADLSVFLDCVPENTPFCRKTLW
jgi:hypothetical protein